MAHSPRHRLRLAVGLALLGIVSIGGRVVSAAFAPTIELRRALVDDDLSLQDVASKADDVAVVWLEDTGAAQELWLRTSTDGGASFRTRRLVDDREPLDAAADVCDEQAWMLHTYRLPDFLVDIYGLILESRPLVGDGLTGMLIAHPDDGYDVRALDLACIGTRRHLLGWIDDTTTDQLYLQFPVVQFDPKHEIPTESFQIDVGSQSEVAVAGTGSRAYAAWVRSNRLRVKSFMVGPGPDYPITPFPTLVLGEDIEPSGEIVMAAHGMDVVVAYSTFADTYVRISTDGGGSFGPRHKLLDGLWNSEFGTEPRSVDLRNARIELYGATIAAAFPGVNVEQFRFRSTDLGESWDEIPQGDQGFRMGALSVVSGDPKLVEAWDEPYADVVQQRLRFHRQE